MDGLKAAMSLFYVKGQIRNTMVFPYVLFVECTMHMDYFYLDIKSEQKLTLFAISQIPLWVFLVLL